MAAYRSDTVRASTMLQSTLNLTTAVHRGGEVQVGQVAGSRAGPAATLLCDSGWPMWPLSLPFPL